MTVLARDEARRVAVAAQGLHGFAAAGDAASVVRRLGCIQIDSMSAVRRSPELVENTEGMARSMLDRAIGAVAEWTGCAAVTDEIPGRRYGSVRTRAAKIALRTL